MYIVCFLFISVLYVVIFNNSVYRNILLLLLCVPVLLLVNEKMGYFLHPSQQAYIQTQPYFSTTIWWNGCLYVHIGSSIIAIVTGILQLFTANKNVYAVWHRYSGKVYYVAVVYIACPTSLILTFYSVAGSWLGMAAYARFLLLTILWFAVTLIGYKKANEKKYTEHGCWMIRSYALTFVDITGRLWSVVLTASFHPDPVDKLLWVLWLSFIGNMIIGEMVVYLIKRKATNFTNWH